MIKWIEASGKNESVAIAAALTRLGMDRDDVSVEVLERAKSGFLGIGSAPARIKVSYEVPDEVPLVSPVSVTPHVADTSKSVDAPKVAPVAKPAAASKPKTVDVPKPKPKPAAASMQNQCGAMLEPVSPTELPLTQMVFAAAQECPVSERTLPDDGAVEESIRVFLSGLLAQMQVEATLCFLPRSREGCSLRIEGKHLGVLIGHRGETLDAIQHLTNYAVNRTRPKRVRIHIDVENYREKREEALRRLAHKVATKVVKYRRNITLEPMNAYERHVIHETLQELPDISTYSTGTEPNRRTIVAYSKGKHSD